MITSACNYILLKKFIQEVTQILILTTTQVGECEEQPPVKKSKEESCYSILNLPEEMICQVGKTDEKLTHIHPNAFVSILINKISNIARCITDPWDETITRESLISCNFGQQVVCNIYYSRK